jgi:hypothetical protein
MDQGFSSDPPTSSGSSHVMVEAQWKKRNEAESGPHAERLLSVNSDRRPLRLLSFCLNRALFAVTVFPHGKNHSPLILELAKLILTNL